MKLAFLKPYIMASTALFAIFLGAGAAFTYAFPELSSILLQAIAEKFREIISADRLKMFFFIFFNNTLIDLIAVSFFFLFGIVPIYFLLSNGFVIGLVTTESLRQASAIEIGAALIPHGILEIPAFILSTSYGIWLGAKFFRKVFYNEPFKEYARMAFRAFFFLILPLNFFAALIEVFITPIIFSYFLK